MVNNSELVSLSEGVFEGLSNLRFLHLRGTGLVSLPEGIFEGLSNLEDLFLWYNKLESLPPGVFSGLTSLKFLNLARNPSYPGVPFTLVMELEKVATNTFRVRVEEGAPDELTTTLMVTGGTASASSVTIPLGSIESDPVVITPDEGATEAVITLGDPPSLPEIEDSRSDARTGFAGVEIGVGDPLTLELEELDGEEPSVTIEDASADEGAPLTFTVVLNGAVPDGLIVTPSLTGVTATQGTDYNATPTPASLTFAGEAGEAHTLTVATIEDDLHEGDVTFTVNLSVSGTAEDVDASDTATGTIIDDDALAVTIADAEAEEGRSLTFTVTLNGAVPGGLIVTPSLGGPVTDGTAEQGTDYNGTPIPASLTFAGTAPEGETKTFAVATIQDAIAEGNETFAVTLVVSGTTEDVDASDAATGTIIDDDALAVTIEDAEADEGESLTFTVTLNGAVSGGLTVTPSLMGVTAAGGVDYNSTPTPAPLTFAGTAGETKTFAVATIEDEIVEGAETFTVDLAVSGTAEAVDASDTATGTIRDDDVLAVTIADASADEGGSLTFTVTLNRAVPSGLIVRPSFEDGTATQGSDYNSTPTPASLTFAGTAEERTFEVATIQDDIYEGDETFTVNLSVSGAHNEVFQGVATGTIRDDDALAVTIADAEADEGAPLTFTVVLNGAVPDGLTVTPSLTGGTATQGTDYNSTPTPASLTFAGRRAKSRRSR